MKEELISISEQLEQIASEICDKYCRYPEIWDEEQDGQLADSEVCKNCPLKVRL